MILRIGAGRLRYERNVSYLDLLEVESIYRLRKVAAEFARPAMLLSVLHSVAFRNG
jgi:hypothetical protein